MVANHGSFEHQPVMVDEIVEAFGSVPAGWIVDATLGGAGHAAAILTAHPHLSVLGIDLVKAQIRVAEPVVGALFDLGVSSPQFDRPDRGFSYRFDAPLDMRMDPSRSTSALTVVNEYSESELTRVLRMHGDERYAARIARRIVAARPVHTTTELAEIVREAIPAPARRSGGHPAKRTFQAIRIEVNDELEVLPIALDAAIESLTTGGRLVVLSYHSGEDRIVKRVMREAESGGCSCPPNLPCVCGAVSRISLLGRGGRIPSSSEIANNPRAESARLRIAVRS